MDVGDSGGTAIRQGCVWPAMQLWRVLRTVEVTVVDPVLRWLLRSPLHWPLSRWFCLLSYDGGADGERVTRPVGYDRAGDILHVVTVRERADWWRHFREPSECTLYLGGDPHRAEGEVVTNAVKHRNHVADFLHPAPALAGPGGEGGIEDFDLTNYVLVEFSLDGDAPSESGAAVDAAAGDDA